MSIWSILLIKFNSKLCINLKQNSRSVSTTWRVSLLVEHRFPRPHVAKSYSRPRLIRSILEHQYFPCSKAKSRKCRGIFKMKNRDKTWQVREKCSQQIGPKPGALQGKCSLLACHICCKCSMAITCNSVDVKLGFKVIKLMTILIGWKVPVCCRGSECHLIFLRGRLHFAG